MEKEKLVIIDSNSILHRAFHALPALTTKKGERTEAIYGFLLVLFKIIKEIQPNFLCACFDFPAKTLRHKKFKEYKISRPPLPDELKEQIKKTKEVLEAFKIPYYEKEGYEADDLIATIASKVKGIQKIVVSGDQDLFQIINPETKIYFLQKGIKETLLIDEKKVAEKFGGLLPEQIPDFKALCGDPSDNIPGAKGIGEKTAISLIKEFQKIENLLEAKNLPERIKKIIFKEKENILLSKKLAILEKEVPINFDLSQCLWPKYNEKEVEKVLQKYEFFSLIKKISELKVSKNLQLL